MKKIKKYILMGIALLIVILIFTGTDYLVHGLKSIWSVPDYYFRNKIRFGFLWGIPGLRLASKVQNIGLKALLFSGAIAVILQTRYFLEGYPLDFVLIFLVIHFVILYCLSLGMFTVFKKYSKK